MDHLVCDLIIPLVDSAGRILSLTGDFILLLPPSQLAHNEGNIVRMLSDVDLIQGEGALARIALMQNG